jgi:threonine 3-dehydrogenase
MLCKGGKSRARAVVKRKPEPGVEFVEVPKLKVNVNEVLTEVKTAAICGSDLGIYDYTSCLIENEAP